MFWCALCAIVLSGDTAMVISGAGRTCEPEQGGQAIFWGSAAATAMRIVLTISAVQLLSLPYLTVVGAIFWVYIGVDLL